MDVRMRKRNLERCNQCGEELYYCQMNKKTKCFNSECRTKRKVCKCGGDLREDLATMGFNCVNVDCPYELATNVMGDVSFAKKKPKHENNINSNQVDHRTAKKDDCCKVCGCSMVSVSSDGLSKVCSNKECASKIPIGHRTMKNIIKDERLKSFEKIADMIPKLYDNEREYTDERIMVDGLEVELVECLKPLLPGQIGDRAEIVNYISALIDARIELNRVQMLPIIKMNIKKCEIEVEPDRGGAIAESIYSSLNLEDLPAFLPLTDFTPDQFALIRNGDRFNVDGRTMHVRFEKKHIPGLRSLKVIKGTD